MRFKVIDAMGKPGSDLMDFHFIWVGNWEECRAVQATVYEDPVNKTGPSHPFKGKSCTASLPLGSTEVCLVITMQTLSARRFKNVLQTK